MRKALFGILISAILILSLSYYSIVSKEQDIFSGYVVEGKTRRGSKCHSSC